MAEYRMCTRCVMDTTDTEIEFDEQGVCSHCLRYDAEIEPRLLSPEAGADVLARTVGRIKAHGEGRSYDSILGLSGGADSSFVAYKAHEWGLRPLPVHFDNGWDSEPAVKNIEKLCKGLDLDLETHVMDWEEFKDIQRAFLKASVLDMELVTDQAYNAALYRIASQRGIKFILNGFNYATESILPATWAHLKRDLRNLKAIHRTYGDLPLKRFPRMGVLKYFWYRVVNRFEVVYPLNYMDYRRSEAMDVLTRELGWQSYGGKHCESLFTYFYQAYMLPLKFNIDKRKAHLSSLILSGQTTREEALRELESEPYPSKAAEQQKAYVAKKLGFSEDEFDVLLARPPVPHSDFPSEEWLYDVMVKGLGFLRSLRTPRKEL